MAATPIPDLSNFCLQLGLGAGELCIQLPGGANICASVDVELGDPSAIVTGLLAQANTALAPLQPFFNLLDFIKAAVDCITAVGDCLGPPPDPTKLLQCLPNLVQAANKLLALVPQLSVPILVKSILDVIITGLVGLKIKLQSMINKALEIAAAATRAAELGNLQLELVVSCAADDLDAQLVNMNQGMAPLNRLIGLLNLLLDLAGLPCIPTLGNINGISSDALAPLDAAIKLLQSIQIPSPSLVLPDIPPADGTC